MASLICQISISDNFQIGLSNTKIDYPQIFALPQFVPNPWEKLGYFEVNCETFFLLELAPETKTSRQPFYNLPEKFFSKRTISGQRWRWSRCSEIQFPGRESNSCKNVHLFHNLLTLNLCIHIVPPFMWANTKKKQFMKTWGNLCKISNCTARVLSYVLEKYHGSMFSCYLNMKVHLHKWYTVKNDAVQCKVQENWCICSSVEVPVQRLGAALRAIVWAAPSNESLIPPNTAVHCKKRPYSLSIAAAFPRHIIAALIIFQVAAHSSSYRC